ncbi:hypothetical protein P3T23_002057 [Paraburkholderia sp. GAS448]
MDRRVERIVRYVQTVSLSQPGPLGAGALSRKEDDSRARQRKQHLDPCGHQEA